MNKRFLGLDPMVLGAILVVAGLVLGFFGAVAGFSATMTNPFQGGPYGTSTLVTENGMLTEVNPMARFVFPMVLIGLSQVLFWGGWLVIALSALGAYKERNELLKSQGAAQAGSPSSSGAGGWSSDPIFSDRETQKRSASGSRNQMRCPDCTKLISDGSLFCNWCGTRC